MGGASLGYINSGNEVILAIDKWEDAVVTHKYNLPETEVVNCDISQLNLDELPYADLYHLSPPCQSFSTSGKQKGFNSDNGNLFLFALDILNKKKPNLFVIENVKGLLNHLKRIKIESYEKLQNYYNITPILVNAKDCGVCQSRERVFIIGIRKGYGEFNTPPIIENDMTFQDVIDNVKNNHGFPNHSQQLINKLKYIPQGGCVLDIPENIRPKSFKNSYSRLRLNQIPPTITRNYNCPSSANCIHPLENRGLSDAEALYIQGFPDNWKVLGRTKNLQIGNAVPPAMIEWIMSGIEIYKENK